MPASLSLSQSLFASLHRSAPAQPPAEGTEGAAPGGGPPGPPPNMTSNRRLQQTQAQVEEVGTWPIPEFLNQESREQKASSHLFSSIQGQTALGLTGLVL